MKTLSEIKFGVRVFDRLIDPDPVTYDQIVRSCGLTAKQVQKTLADLCKAGYVRKEAKGYSLTDTGLALVKDDDGQETTTGL